ncbi:MAG: hypothetical protein ACRC2N_09345 [Aeromonas sp.]
MAVQKKLKHVQGLAELDAMLESLIDPKFRARALRKAGKATLQPVEQVLKSKLPDGGSDHPSYKHYGQDGYTAGDLKNGTRITMKVNTAKPVKTDKKGNVAKGQRSELYGIVTFKPKLVKLANILEHGRTKRIARTDDGNVFNFYGKPTDKTERDIGTTEPKNFISSTVTECESAMVETFKNSLLDSVTKEVKRQERAIKRAAKKKAKENV